MVEKEKSSPEKCKGENDPFAMLEAEQLKQKASATPKDAAPRKIAKASSTSNTKKARRTRLESDSDSEASEDERWAREREERRKRALEDIDKQYENRAKQRAVMEKTAEERAKVQEAALQAGYTPLERYILRSGEIAEKYKVSDLKIKDKTTSKDGSNKQSTESGTTDS
ncbi:hypothetical protein FOL47_007726 [Perkinsus chesapeaki]|uniref:Uncharacterized protein n=1 Tax=Perkinsus chesapeaki TaxID=330153 RepID=A0A7J6LIF5_PERCH|nr:hypothetical protein FOL47_007726 [Perkinsus chesapeaki]